MTDPPAPVPSHIEHTCQFVNGELERIDETSPFSPDYPEGQELPPASCEPAHFASRASRDLG